MNPEPDTNFSSDSESQPKSRTDAVTRASGKLFPITSTTLVDSFRSGGDLSREVSLAKFCTIYYPSIYGFARMMGLSIDDAQDRTQDFFVKVVEEQLLQKYDPEHGSRLSSWLIKCFKNLVLNHLEAQRSKRRGGGMSFVEFDSLYAEDCLQPQRNGEFDAETGFDATLAKGLWVKTETLLKEKHRGKSSHRLAEALIPYLLLSAWPAPPAPSQAAIAENCGTTAVTLKAFFNHTLKKQAKRLFQEMAVEHCPGIGEEEVTYLWEILRHGR